MEHTKHLWRAAILLVIGATVAVVARFFLLPDSWGEKGYYRADSLSDYMAIDPRHGDETACQPCHADRFAEKLAGKHATVSCEVCHAPLYFAFLDPEEGIVGDGEAQGAYPAVRYPHADETGKLNPMPTDTSHRLCANCHQKLRARPENMPQIVLEEHLVDAGAIEKGEEIPEGVCIACHDVHDPTL